MQIDQKRLSGLGAGPAKLSFVTRVEAEPGTGLVPLYHFTIIGENGKKAGHINFKTGSTEHILQYAGHIGFNVTEEYRGRSYAYWACIAIAPLVRSVYNEVIITCNPDNTASRKTIEKLPATFLDEVVVPVNDPAYASGSRIKRRYVWIP